MRNCYLLTENSFKMRRYYLCRYENDGFLKKKANFPAKDPMQMMANQNMMTSMLTNNVSQMVSMTLQYGWVNYLFSGFILGKAR